MTGNAEAGSTVSIRLGDGSTVTTIAGSNGTYSYTFLNKQTEGQTLQITATDAAGNTGVTSPPFNLTVDTSVPEAPVFTPATDNAGPVLGPIAPSPTASTVIMASCWWVP